MVVPHPPKARGSAMSDKAKLDTLIEAAKLLKSRMCMRTYPHEPASMWCDEWEWGEFLEVLEELEKPHE